MLFSQPELADWISDTFECAWESVRDVPRVTVDFGGERVTTKVFVMAPAEVDAVRVELRPPETADVAALLEGA